MRSVLNCLTPLNENTIFWTFLIFIFWSQIQMSEVYNKNEGIDRTLQEEWDCICYYINVLPFSNITL